MARGQWREYEDGKKREFVYSLHKPWRYGNGSARGGRPPNNDPRASVICLPLKMWLRSRIGSCLVSFRELVSMADDRVEEASW